MLLKLSLSLYKPLARFLSSILVMHQVQGVITGPMGSLGTTMDTLSKMSENEELLCQIEKRIKNSLVCVLTFISHVPGTL